MDICHFHNMKIGKWMGNWLEKGENKKIIGNGV